MWKQYPYNQCLFYIKKYCFVDPKTQKFFLSIVKLATFAKILGKIARFFNNNIEKKNHAFNVLKLYHIHIPIIIFLM